MKDTNQQFHTNHIYYSWFFISAWKNRQILQSKKEHELFVFAFSWNIKSIFILLASNRFPSSLSFALDLRQLLKISTANKILLQIKETLKWQSFQGCTRVAVTVGVCITCLGYSMKSGLHIFWCFGSHYNGILVTNSLEIRFDWTES